MKKTMKIILPLILIVAICINSSFALLSARTNKISNEFNFSYTDIKLTEPSWDPNAPNIYNPGQIINKDPQITNTGSQEAYVYMSVFIPYVNTGRYALTYDYKTHKYENIYKEASQIEAFSYDYGGTGWEDVYASEYKTTMVHEGEKYNGELWFYYYKTPLMPNETTTPLFNNLKMQRIEPERVFA